MLSSVRGMVSLPSSSCCVWWMMRRWKSLRFKPNRARMNPMKSATRLALDHFDFYYAPVYGEAWSSIRLGLLSPKKYMAVVNNLSRTANQSAAMLEKIGAVDVMGDIDISSSSFPSTSDHGDNRLVSEYSNDENVDDDRGQTGLNHDRGQTGLNHDRSQTGLNHDRGQTGLNHDRSQTGLHQFIQSKKHYDPESAVSLPSSDGIDFQITGFEGRGFELTSIIDSMQWPVNLRLFCHPRTSLAHFPPSIRNEHGEPGWWLLDGASIVPVLSLGLVQGDSLLDICAAPGGKSLLALQTTLPSVVVCNDVKMSRLGQLRRALASYVPMESDIGQRVMLKRKDASNLITWDELDTYDKVLADVPCTTDRISVERDEGNLFATASANERLELPKLQTQLNSLRAVRVGGVVVYSTCTLSPVQNEGVVENACAIAWQRFGISVRELKQTVLEEQLTSTGLFRFSQRCCHGSLVVPFLPSNFGPMYICKLERLR